MRFLVNGPTRLAYRACESRDFDSLHEMMRGTRTWAALHAAVAAQLDADDGDDYRALAAGSRVLIATDGGAVVGMVRAVLSSGERWTANVESRGASGQGERPLEFAGDALAWLHLLGVEAAEVTAYCRACPSPFHDGLVPPRRVSWSADPIPRDPLGLPRDLTWARVQTG